MKLTRTAATHAALVLPTLAGEIALAAEHTALMTRLALSPALKSTWIGLGATCAVLILASSLVSFVQVSRWARGTQGRTRLLVASASASVNVCALALVMTVIVRSDAPPLLKNGISLGLAPDQMLAVVSGGGVALLSLLAWLGASVGTWFLIQPATRRTLWRVIDVVMLFVAVAAIVLLPAQPPASAPNALQLPVLRHVITTLAVLRLIVRVVPWLMDLVESLGYQALIAARHLRAKKSGFLAVISMLAVMAVTVSSCALTTTLSVMGGFRNDLKRKILGSNAHVVVDRDNRTIERWEPLLDTTRNAADVIGAAPYVSGEVMLSSASNLATAVLRGIDPAHVGEVSDLPRNIRSGKLDYLTSPEKLLDLPPDVMGKMLLPINDSVLGGAANGDDLAAPQRPADPKDKVNAQPSPDAGARGDRVADALAEFLVDEPDRTDPDRKAAPRDALPGIIIGQELARSLRLYLGDEVNVVAPLGALGPAGPMPKSRPFRVAGIFYSGMYEYDMKYTYVTLPTAQRFLNTGDTIHGVEIKTRDTELAPQVAAHLRKALADREVRVRDWQELNSRLFGALALEKLAMFIALGIAILVASFCIAATLMLMVQEKGRQIAVLKAIGSPDRAIVTVFVLEGLLIGAFGSALGLFLGYMMCFAFEHFGIRMNPEVYYIDKLPVHIEPSEFVLVGIASIVVCLLVTIYPAVLGSRLRPVDALRYE